MRGEFAKDCVILTTDKSKTILLVKWQHLWGILEFDSNCGNWTEDSHTIVHCIQIGIASVAAILWIEAYHVVGKRPDCKAIPK